MSISHNRRAVIGTIGLMTLPGCLGYKIQKTNVDERQVEQISSLNERVSNLESQLESEQSEVDDLEQRVETLQTEKSDLQSQNQNLNEELSAVEGELATAKVDHVVALYEAGEEAFLFGNGAWSNGVDAWNEQNYASATGFFGRAYADYSRASDAFSQSRDKSIEYDLDGEGLIDIAIELADGLSEAGFDMENAAYYGAINDASAASDYQDQAEDHLASVSELDLAEVQEVERTLQG